MDTKKAVFRVDASARIGSGHLMRCVTLANSLRSVGVRCEFICRDLPGNYVPWLRSRGYPVNFLSAPKLALAPDAGQYQSWLGVPMEVEIGQSRALLAQAAPPDWLVVDHYALDAVWENAVLPSGASMLVIDDIANREHACQLLLNQNYHPQAQARYNALADGAKLLLGPRYALLRPEFSACRQFLDARNSELKRLLVFLGGSDEANVTGSVLRGLVKLRARHLEIEVIIGQANTHCEELGSLCAALGARLLLQVDDMAERMARADLSIGAAGVATWERAAVGLPTLAVSVADNQRDIARHANAMGLLRWLGDAHEMKDEDWTEAVQWALSNREALRQQSISGMQLVDGHGTARVVENMIGNHRPLH